MLTTKKYVTLEGSSAVDGAEVEHYTARINTDALDRGPEYTSYIVDGSIYRSSRSTCAQDRAAFEDTMYATYDAIVAETQI